MIYCKFGNFRDKARFTYINKRQSDFAILRGFYFRETSHMQNFVKKKSSPKFSNLQYAALSALKINAEGRYKSLKTVF